MILALGSLWVHAQRAPLNKPLSALLPPGALIYLEALDFNSLLTRWNGSSERKLWLASDNYSTLSRSRLLGRLAQAQDEFKSAANVSPQMQLLTQVAGQESAFAFYDLGNLRFVYITRLEAKRLNANELWQKRPNTNSGKWLVFRSMNVQTLTESERFPLQAKMIFLLSPVTAN
jgi:hypothetical protein